MNLKGLDQISEKLENISEKQMYYIFAGLLILFFALDYFLLMGPQLHTLTKINPEIEVLSEDLTKAKNDIARAAQYSTQIEKLEKDLWDMGLKVRSRNEVPFILERVSRIANESDIKLDQIFPQSDELEVALEEKEKKYYFLPIQIEAKGGYHDFGRFINNIENDEFYLKVKSFVIKETDNPKKHQITLKLYAVIFDETDS